VAARDVVPIGLPFTDEDCVRDGFTAGVCGRLADVLVVFVERFALLRFFAMALSALYIELARKPLGFSQGTNGPSPAGDKLPTCIAVSACLCENAPIGTLHLTNRILFAGSTVSRSCG
jgi:hypothetical protein